MKASNIERRIRSLAGKGIHKYNMVQDGDRILVAVSGGKDSLTALWTLRERLRRVPINYDLIPIYLEMGYNTHAHQDMEEYFRSEGYSYRVETTDYAVKAHSDSNRENPCFLCSRLRRKHLFEVAASNGCNKVALGHNQDDIIETLFINMFFGASITTMKPIQPLFKGKLTIIRPLALTPEKIVARFAAKKEFSLIKNACPSALHSRRTQIRTLLKELYKTNKKIRGNIFHAMHNVDPDYLL